MANQDEHIKYYNSKGEEVPSTTTVLKIYNKNLDGWANWMGLKGIKLEPWLREKANFGTYIHSICEKYFSPDMKVDIHPDLNWISTVDYLELLDRFQLVKDRLESMGYIPYKQEFVVHGERYGGTMDLLFYSESNDDYILIDLKTAKDTYNTMYMQLMGYVQLLQEKYNMNVSQVAILLIFKDTSDENFLKFYNTKGEYCQHYLDIFNGLLNIYYILTNEERGALIS